MPEPELTEEERKADFEAKMNNMIALPKLTEEDKQAIFMKQAQNQMVQPIAQPHNFELAKSGSSPDHVTTVQNDLIISTISKVGRSKRPARRPKKAKLDLTDSDDDEEKKWEKLPAKPSEQEIEIKVGEIAQVIQANMKKLFEQAMPAQE